MYEHLTEASASLDCPICRSSLEQPVMLTRCGHVYCAACLSRAFSTNKSCPIDRLPVEDARKEVVKAPNLVRELLSELRVRCTLCEWEGRRDEWEGHGCQKLEVEDSKTASTSTTEDACSECPHCQMTIAKENSLPSHYLYCERIPVPCMYARFGCEEKTPRRSAQTHLDGCLYAKLGNFFNRFDEEITNLQDENMVLRARISSLEDSLQTVEQNSRNALGKYYSADTLSTASTEKQQNTTIESDLGLLQANLASLSLTLESVDLRTEMLVQNEAMRLQEDLNGLRATVHGVRTQVWNLLIERDRERMPMSMPFMGPPSLPTEMPTSSSDPMPDNPARGLRRLMSAGANATNMSLYAAMQGDRHLNKL